VSAFGTQDLLEAGDHLATRTGRPGTESVAGALMIALASLMYLAAFNFVTSDAIRLSVAATITLLAGASGARFALVSSSLRVRLSFPMLLVLPAIWMLMDLSQRYDPSYVTGSRLVLPLMAGVGWSAVTVHGGERFAQVLAAVVCGLGVMSALFAGAVEVGGLTRLAPFSGGDDGAHATAYLIAIALIATISAWPRRRRRRLRRLALITLTSLLVWAQVATALILVATYLAARWLADARLAWPRKAMLSVVGACAAAGIVIWHELLTTDGAGPLFSSPSAGSGRFGAWAHRIELLGDRPASELLFGSGPASDRFVTDVWWWEAKDAHSDLLTILIENGAIGLFVVSATLLTIARGRRWALLPFVSAMGMTSLISNALLARPIHAVLFWFVAVASVRNPNNGAGQGSVSRQSDDVQTKHAEHAGPVRRPRPDDDALRYGSPRQRTSASA
jgi:hypothetical protein